MTDADRVGRPRPDGPRLSILIVNYRSTELLVDCLASIAAQTAFAATETIVVDNGTPGFDAARIEAAHPWARILASPTNLTYTGGNNRAFELAAGSLVLLLNPDTVLEPTALARAMAHFDERPEMAGLAAWLLNDDGSFQRYYRRLPRPGDAPYLLLGRLLASTPGGRRYAMSDVTFDDVTPVDQPPGAFIMLRRTAVGHGPLLDPGYGNYMSDVELCARLRATGPILVFRDVRCRHRKGAAGVATADPRDQLRLRHDLTLGVRRYFRRRSRAARAVRRGMAPHLLGPSPRPARDSPSWPDPTGLGLRTPSVAWGPSDYGAPAGA